MMSRIDINSYLAVDLNSDYKTPVPQTEWLQIKEDSSGCSRAVDEVAMVSAGCESLPLAHGRSSPESGGTG
jgi:hypothetical protein